jgi:hypothetical protein
LSGWFPNGLPSDDANSFTWLNNGFQILDIQCSLEVLPGHSIARVFPLFLEKAVWVGVAVLGK